MVKKNQQLDHQQSGKSDDVVQLRNWTHQMQDGKYVKLLAFYNSSINSLRTIEHPTQTVQAHRHLSIRKIGKSTLSDFNALAAPARPEPLIQALQQSLHKQSSMAGIKNGDSPNFFEIHLAAASQIRTPMW